MSRILITGGRGQLGKDCARVFALAHDVLVTDMPEADICDYDGMRCLIEQFAPNYIVNCAAYTAVDKAESEFALAEHINSDGPRNLARLCHEKNISLIHISTDYVFDGNREIPISWQESDECLPTSVYGKTKRVGELAIVESKCHYAIFRTAWLYGVGGKNFPKTMLRLALADENQVRKVVADQFGCPTSSLRLAKQILAYIELDITSQVPSQIFHSVCSGYTCWFEFAKYFLEKMQVSHNLVSCTSSEFPTPAKRPHNSILDCSGLKSLGIYVMGDWHSAVDEFVENNREFLLKEAREL